jgi:hypothetical protein
MMSHLGCNNNSDILHIKIDTMARQWKIIGQEGWEKSLKYETDVRVPSAEELGEMQVLVKLHAASLNYRELMIPAVNVSLPRRCSPRITNAAPRAITVLSPGPSSPVAMALAKSRQSEPVSRTSKSEIAS